MLGTSTITSKGQVTLPQALRVSLDLQSGDQVYFEADYEQKIIKVKKSSPKSVVDQLAGSLHSPMGYVDLDIVRQKAGEELGKKYQVK